MDIGETKKKEATHKRLLTLEDTLWAAGGEVGGWATSLTGTQEGTRESTGCHMYVMNHENPLLKPTLPVNQPGFK